MKVLWLSHLIPYPPKGGVLQRSYNLLREIARYHEVYLLAFRQNDLVLAHFDSLEEGENISRKELSSFCKDIKFIPIPCDKSRFDKVGLAIRSLVTPDPYTINWLKSDEYSQAINDWLHKYEFDFIHFDTISFAPYLDLFSSIPRCLDHHNIESHMMIRRSQIEPNLFKKIYFLQEGLRLKNYEKKVCAKFDVNITCSDLDTIRLREINPSINAITIPNGVDLSYFKPLSTEKKMNSIVFAGTLNWYPNQQAVELIAFELWPKLKSEIPDVTIDIIGAYPPQSIVALSRKDKSFNVHGFVDDVRPYLDRATVYICPITDGGGTKLKILDALAMQKPIIAHPIACEGIEVVPGRNVFFAECVDDYISNIRNLFNNEELRLTVGKNSRQLIEDKYSYQSIGKNLSLAFEKCVG